TEQERFIELHVGGGERIALEIMEIADGATHALRRLEHGGRVHEGLGFAGLGVLPTLAQDADDRLADRQIASRGDRHDALAGLDEEVELAERGDVVDAGVGARVREHHQAVTNEKAAEIGHRTPQRSPKVYSDPRRQAAMPAQFCVCWAACATRTLTESASPSPP